MQLRKQMRPESFISNHSKLAVKHRFGLATALEILEGRAENEALEIVKNSASAILTSELENDGSSASSQAREAFERTLVWGKPRDAFQGQPEEPLDTSVSLSDVASQSRSQASDALHEALSNHLGLTLPPPRATAACEVSQMDGPELERQRATLQLILLRKAEAREQSNTASSATQAAPRGRCTRRILWPLLHPPASNSEVTPSSTQAVCEGGTLIRDGLDIQQRSSPPSQLPVPPIRRSMLMFPYSMLCKTSMRLVMSSPHADQSLLRRSLAPNAALLDQNASSQIALQIPPHRLHLLDEYRIAQLSGEMRQRMQVESTVRGGRSKLREHSAQHGFDRHSMNRESGVDLPISLRPGLGLVDRLTGLWSHRTTSCTPHAAPISRPTFVTWLKFASFVSSDLPRRKSS